jgi:hypothetical protein
LTPADRATIASQQPTMTADDFRDIALSMNGATEGSHMGHPDFRANGRIFATLHPGFPPPTARRSAAPWSWRGRR